MRKRILSLALTFIMLLSLVPAAAFADAGAQPAAGAGAADDAAPAPVAEPAASAEPAPAETPAATAEPAPSAAPEEAGEPDAAEEPSPSAEPEDGAEEEDAAEDEEDAAEEAVEPAPLAARITAGAFDASLLNGIPANADPGTGTTKWGSYGGMLVSGNQGKSYTSSTLTLTFTADVQVSFEYRVSTEARYDVFSITHNGSAIVSGASGKGSWTGMQVTCAAGDTLAFKYTKDSSGDSNDDTVYLRNFSAGEPVVVTFHANNGTDETVTQNFFGASALKLNAFEKDHGVFVGWAASAGGEILYTDGQTIDKPEEALELYAVWAPACVVTFSDAGLSVNVKTGSALGAENVPSAARTGYNFAGWYSGGAAFDPSAPINSDITCSAQWSPISYTVRFNSNNGIGSMQDMPLSYDQSAKLPACGYARAGYSFKGWSTSSGASTADYTDGQTVSNLTAKDGAIVDLYAVWAGNKLTLTVDLNYDTDGRTSTRTCIVGQNYNYAYDEASDSVNFSALPDPDREGYMFTGWFDAPDGGNEITTKYKFPDDSPMTIYAHWIKSVTITFSADASGYPRSKKIPAGTSYGVLPTLRQSGKAFDGWYTEPDGGTAVTKDTVFNADTTLYARFRNYQYIIKFDANGGTGTMEDVHADFNADITLPKNGFTRDGYVFKCWSTSKYSSYTTYNDGAVINREYDDWDSSDGETYRLYAMWTETTFGLAFRTIEAKLPSGNIVRSTGSLSLPTSGSGYTVSYKSGSSSITDDMEVVKLPDNGTYDVRITATVTDLADGSTQSRDYVLTLYSTEAVEIEETLTKAAKSLSGTFTPVYGTDTNACAAVEKILAGKGYTGIKVSVKEPASNQYSSIAADGTISYYFNPSMTGRGGYFYTTFILSYKGTRVEKEWYTNLTWDIAKAKAKLEDAAGRLAVPTEPVSELKLLHYPLKDGVAFENADFSSSGDFETWATVTWSSADTKTLKIGSAPYYPYYSPYAVTLKPDRFDKTVTVTASLVCNNVSGLTVSKVFNIIVKGSETDPDELLRHELEQKLEAGLKDPGLTDFVTGEPLDTGNVINDIQFPTTRDFGVDGKYQPVTITSSNTSVIADPDVNNAARVFVYRPLPGEDPVDVTLTVAITDLESGVRVSKDITVTVQPLDSDEIYKEIALMQLVKEHYFDGIKNANTDPGNITTDLHPFQEAYLDDAGNLVWVYNYAEMKDHGIVPAELDGWYASEQWRLFKSSNAAVISHENLLVTRDKEHKRVTISSCLSSETYGKYAELYPDNQLFKLLYRQPVSVELTVTGTDPSSDKPDDKYLTVGFTLSDNGSVWFSTKYDKLNEGVTVYDVFSTALAEHGYSAVGGSFVTGIVRPDGGMLSQKDRGEYSGWMYAVNGAIPNIVMTQYYLKNGDNIVFFYTDDYTKLTGMSTSYTPDDVIKLIDAIGTVTKDSADKITAARKAYDSLSQADKGKVSNRNTLFEAERAYAAIIKNNQKKLDIYTITGDYIEKDDDEKLAAFGSEWLVLGLARSGRDVPGEYYKAIEKYVDEHIDDSGRLDVKRSSDNSRLILALTATGRDVTDVAGHDLLTALGDLDYIEKQSLSGVIYALLALDSGDYEIPVVERAAIPATREALIQYLLDAQLEDGGWAFSGDEAEPDMTAMAVQALAGYYEAKPAGKLGKDVKEAVDKAVDVLSGMQTTTGGYESYGDLNSESASQVIVALTALGIDPDTDSRFIKNGVSVVDSLCSFYVDGGGFRHVMDGERDDIATAQGYYALTAYYRLMDEKTALYDMTDLLQQSENAIAA